MWFEKRIFLCLHSFRVRVFLALTLIVLTVIPATGYFCYLQARRVAEKQMQQYTMGTAEQIVKRVHIFLERHTYNVKLIKSFLENRGVDLSDDKAILNCLYLFKQSNPEFINLLYGDETGRFLMVPPQIPEVHKIYDPRVRPWYKGAIQSGNHHWTDVYLFASTQKPGMTVSVPLYDTGEHGGEARVKAVCGIDIELSALSKFLRTIRIGENGFAYIFENREGRVIAHPDLLQFPWSPYHIDLLRTCLTDLKEKGKSFGMSKFRGDNFFTAYTAYSDYPHSEWTVGVTLPVSDFLQNVTSIRNAIISLVIVGIFLALFLSYLIAMTIVRPLNVLKKGIERITNGDLNYKVDIKDPDIAASLAASFNNMAFSLNESNQELKDTYAQLAHKEKLAAVGQMTAGIAHEIKNPLGIILGSAQVVANDERPWEMRKKAALFIMDEVVRLNRTLTSFLEFARPAPPLFQTVQVQEILEDLLAATGERFQEDGIGVVKSFPPALPGIWADPDQVRQVLLNILINATQSMPDGGTITLKLSPETVDNGSYVRLSVMDQGCGMTKDQMATVWDPFVSFKDQGTGLGLSIVSQIVKIHDGAIHMESEAGKGTRFDLLFPVTVPSDMQEGA